MKRLITTMAFTATVLAAGIGFAAEKTVTLAVENMFCASCPYIVKKSLARVTGVTKVDVSFERKTAMVTFDDAKTNIEALTGATFDAGYPSELKN
ncbi:MAG: mercury resistance system periplasmic binding protein MerP [Rhodospirillales bacterium]|nr:mercury resistance system periplasmic binding protein MerP [Rhodospirillales bacterium]